jgi:hypothetical protein
MEDIIRAEKCDDILPSKARVSQFSEVKICSQELFGPNDNVPN